MQSEHGCEVDKNFFKAVNLIAQVAMTLGYIYIFIYKLKKQLVFDISYSWSWQAFYVIEYDSCIKKADTNRDIKC